MNRATLTVAEVSQVLGIGRNKAYHAVKTGEIPSLRFGGRIVVSKKVLDRMLEVPEPKGEETSHGQ